MQLDTQTVLITFATSQLYQRKKNENGKTRI